MEKQWRREALPSRNGSDVRHELRSMWEYFLDYDVPQAQWIPEVAAALSNCEYYWYWCWKRDNPEAKWWEFVGTICDEEEKRVKREIREKSRIPVFDSGDVGRARSESS